MTLMDFQWLLKLLLVAKLWWGGANPILGNQGLGLDADLWNSNLTSSYGKIMSFKGKIKVLSIH